MILVTGAAGKTGLAVISALSRANISSRALVFRQEQVETTLHGGASEAIVGDMRDSALLDEALQGISAVYHICPNVHPDELLMGQKIIASSRKTSLELLVYHSVIHPQIEKMPHHWQKLRVEEAVLESGLPFVILQPAPYMQNLLASWQSIVREGTFRVPYSPDTRLSLVDLDDVAEAAVQVLTSKGYLGGIFELSAITAMTQTEVARLLTQKIGRHVAAVHMPIDEWRRKAQAEGLGPYALDTLELMFRHYDSYGLHGNNKILSWILNRKPATLADFIERETSRFRSR